MTNSELNFDRILMKIIPYLPLADNFELQNTGGLVPNRLSMHRALAGTLDYKSTVVWFCVTFIYMLIVMASLRRKHINSCVKYVNLIQDL